jgi:diguanylate cyclase (GGDEF)-like protein
MTVAAIALAAALAALCVVGLVAAAGSRARRDSELRVTTALLQLGRRMDALSGELGAAVDRVREDSRRARAIDALGQSLDLDEVLARTADAVAALPGADASVVHWGRADGDPLVAVRGLTAPVAPSHEIAGPPDGAPVRAVALSYHYSDEAEPEQALRSAIAVPLRADGAPGGFIAVYSRSADAAIEPDAFSALEAIAQHAGPAIENARLFDAAQRLSETDPQTGLLNRRGYEQALVREVARAHRYGHALSVCEFDLDGFKAVNDAIGVRDADDVLAAVAQRIGEAAHKGDLVSRVSGNSFTVLLPGSPRIEAEGLFARVQAGLRRVPLAQAPGLTLSCGIAELAPDDESLALLARAHEALVQAKRRGGGTAA